MNILYSEYSDLKMLVIGDVHICFDDYIVMDHCERIMLRVSGRVSAFLLNEQVNEFLEVNGD